MKIFIALLLLTTKQSLAQLPESKIDSNFSKTESIKDVIIDNELTIKYDENQWDYLSYENLNKYHPHLFAYKKLKLKLVFETLKFDESFKSDSDLINSYCSKKDILLKKGNAGFARMESINNVATCYVENKVISGNLIHYFVFPETKEKKKNKLYQFLWTTVSKKKKDIVTAFIQTAYRTQKSN